jgi:hypothetical protein
VGAAAGDADMREVLVYFVDDYFKVARLVFPAIASVVPNGVLYITLTGPDSRGDERTSFL